MNTLNAFLIPIGVVTGAIVTGLFSYLALIITKENKTSEFRQSWIDALRKDVTEFLACVRLINYTIVNLKAAGGAQIPKEKQIQAISDPYGKLCASYNSTLLRLNPDNAESLALIDALKNVADEINSGRFDKASDQVADVREKARHVLKAEWERVKEGEIVFTRSKKYMHRLFVFGIILLCGLLAAPFVKDVILYFYTVWCAK